MSSIKKNELRQLIRKILSKGLSEVKLPGGPGGAVADPKTALAALFTHASGDPSKAYVTDATPAAKGVYSIAEKVPEGVNIEFELRTGSNSTYLFNITEFMTPNRPVINLDTDHNGNEWSNFMDHFEDSLDYPLYEDGLLDVKKVMMAFGGDPAVYKEVYAEKLWEKIKDIVGAGQPDYSNTLPLVIKSSGNYYNALQFLCWDYYNYTTEFLRYEIENTSGPGKYISQVNPIRKKFLIWIDSRKPKITNTTGDTEPTAYPAVELTGRLQTNENKSLTKRRKRNTRLLKEAVTSGADAGNVFYDYRRDTQEGTATAYPNDITAADPTAGPFALVIYGPPSRFGISAGGMYKVQIPLGNAASLKREIAFNLASFINSELGKNASLLTDDFGIWAANPAGFYNIFKGNDMKSEIVRAFQYLGLSYGEPAGATPGASPSAVVPGIVTEPEKPTEEGKCISPNAPFKPNFKGSKADRLREIEEVIDLYSALYSLTTEVTRDGNPWNESDRTAWQELVNHVSKTNPTFTAMNGNWPKIGNDWQSGASTLSGPGYTPDINGMLAFAADAYNCEVAFGKKKQSGGGGSSSKPEPEAAAEEAKPEQKLQTRTWKDIEIEFGGRIKDNTKAAAWKVDIAKVTAKFMVSNGLVDITREEHGIFNLRPGGSVIQRKSDKWKVSKDYQKIILKAINKIVTGVIKTQGTLEISIPPGHYVGMNTNEAAELVGILRTVIRASQ